MSPSTRSSEPRRITTATILLILGLLLLLWSWGSWVYRANVERQEATATRASPPEHASEPTVVPDRESKRRLAIRAMPLVLVVTTFLVFVVLIGMFLIRRAARRYFAMLGRRRASRTVTEDLWSQHRLPDDNERHGPDHEQE